MNCIVSVILSFLFATSALAESHTRLLVHGTHSRISDTHIGLVGWFIMPNVTNAPGLSLSLAGPRYDGTGWNIELLGGAMVESNNSTALVDIRLELTPKFWNAPLYSWGNLEWINTDGKGTGYFYWQVDYPLPQGLGLVGLETENVFPLEDGEHHTSVGPQIVLPLGRVAMVTAYQFHSDGTQQLWLRTVLNL